MAHALAANDPLYTYRKDPTAVLPIVVEKDQEFPEPAFKSVQPFAAEDAAELNGSVEFEFILPEVDVKLTAVPIQGEVLLAPAVIAGGAGATVTATVAAELQPNSLKPLTVYVVSVVGLAITAAEVVPFKPKEGVQV
jgi:hypothetical protein